jgi:hypothetical protein
MSNQPEVIHRSDYDENAKFVLSWWGWASPIGISIFLLSAGVAAVLIRFAIVGIT